MIEISLEIVAWIVCIVVQACIHYFIFGARKERVMLQQKEEEMKEEAELELEAEAELELEREQEEFNKSFSNDTNSLISSPSEQREEEERVAGMRSSSTILGRATSLTAMTIPEEEEEEKEEENNDADDGGDHQDDSNNSLPFLSLSLSSSFNCIEESQSSLTKENAILLQQRLNKSYSQSSSLTKSAKLKQQAQRIERLNKSMSSFDDPKFYLIHRTGTDMLKRCTLERRVEEHVQAVPE